jgi:hypothetical protein
VRSSAALLEGCPKLDDWPRDPVMLTSQTYKALVSEYFPGRTFNQCQSIIKAEANT